MEVLDGFDQNFKLTNFKLTLNLRDLNKYFKSFVKEFAVRLQLTKSAKSGASSEPH